MIRPGLVSITFRALSVAEVIETAAKAKLEGIEWGGDVHVPHGEIDRAEEVQRLTADAGLAVAAYGSYYRVGHNEPAPFEQVLATAVALEAPTVRVWAGKQGSNEADAAYREQVAEDGHRIAHMARGAGLTVSFEFHRRTLTDTAASAVQLLDDIDCDAALSYWQPSVGMSADECVAALDAVLPRLTNLHVFHWSDDAKERFPLADGADRWRRYLARAATTGRDHYAMFEFVRGDVPESLLADAETLRQLLAEVNE